MFYDLLQHGFENHTLQNYEFSLEIEKFILFISLVPLNRPFLNFQK